MPSKQQPSGQSTFVLTNRSPTKTTNNKPNKVTEIMTINIYPEIVRQQDLSPDQGFGPDIDDACNVSTVLKTKTMNSVR